MSKPNNAPAKGSTGASKNNEWFAPAVMIISLIVAELVFHMIMGNRKRLWLSPILDIDLLFTWVAWSFTGISYTVMM